MLSHDKNDAALMNRINDISSDHTLWIKEQIGKGTFVTVHGREVWIKVPGRNLSRIVDVPESGSVLYRKAWIDVYNYCLDFLEGSINAACLENKFIQRMGNVWTLNGNVIRWPKFDEMSSDYARGLESILKEYVYVKQKYLSSMKKDDGISVKKMSINIKNSNDVKISPSKEVKLKVVPKLQYDKAKKIENLTLDEEPLKNRKPVLSKAPVKKTRVEPTIKPRVQLDDSLIIQKVSDGDLIGDRDIQNFKNTKTDIVVLTCMNVLNPKDEDLFIKNARKCHKEGIVTGAFIYGKATDEHEGASELKIMLKILSKFEEDFSGLVYYSINNDFVRKNRKNEDKLLEFISMFNAVVGTLKQSGYIAMLSMNLESGKVLSEICQRNNVQIEHDISYMVVVRDAYEVSEVSSKIVVDPWNDYDIVSIKNTKIRNSIIK